MKFKKITYTLFLAASILLTYNAIAADNATEVSPFENKVEATDIEPAVIKDLKVLGKDSADGLKNFGSDVSDGAKDAGQTIKKDISNFADEVTDGALDAKEAVVDALKVKDKTETTLPVLEDIKLPELKSNSMDAKTVKVEVSSQRIPAGTVIPVKLETAISTTYVDTGDQFTAILPADVLVGDKILLPAGSVIRGTVGKTKKANFCRKEAQIMLIFDHIVTPAGKQLPIYAYMTGYSNVNYEGYITGGTSYAKEFKKDASKGKDIVVNATTYGVDKGLEYWGGVPVVLTAPVCALGGAIGGCGYIVGKSIYNVFVKGDEVNLGKGTVMNITLAKPLDVPVN
ncbi:MAG: hypothetical protein K6A44_01930 [bacterium]|nr:hypothetical protein [bacterium]